MAKEADGVTPCCSGFSNAVEDIHDIERASEYYFHHIHTFLFTFCSKDISSGSARWEASAKGIHAIQTDPYAEVASATSPIDLAVGRPRAATGKQQK